MEDLEDIILLEDQDENENSSSKKIISGSSNKVFLITLAGIAALIAIITAFFN